jgi:hypothetical protein
VEISIREVSKALLYFVIRKFPTFFQNNFETSSCVVCKLHYVCTCCVNKLKPKWLPHGFPSVGKNTVKSSVLNR